MTLCLHGNGITTGVAIGPAHIFTHSGFEITEYYIETKYIAEEIQRFQNAIISTKSQLKSIVNNIPASTPHEISSFIDTHLLMLDDPMLSTTPADIIRQRNCNAEWALKLQRDSIVEIFDNMDDPYLRTRRDDVNHVVNTIMQNLLSGPIHHSVQHEQEQRLSGHIIIADDLSPSDLVLMQNQGIAAFVTQMGGPTSHTAIIARSLNLPAIAGIHNVHQYLKSGETIIVDGRYGLILASPDDNQLNYYHNVRHKQQQQLDRYQHTKHQPAITRDNHEIKLQANIELPEEISLSNTLGANGIGLYRTEYLFMNRSKLPDEEEQYQAYVNVLNDLNGQSLTIRTLDVGSDKQVDSGKQHTHIITNPALGLRAIRLCLNELQLFIPQLRAILRTSIHGPVRMMIPMLTNTYEVRQVIRLVKQTQQDLLAEGLAFDRNMPIGGMIEVPAAAISASMFADELDFLSIGTNDLIQYTLAIDRVDDEVTYLYEPLHPAVIQLIAQTIAAGKKAKIPVTMCGEMAGDPRYTKLLIGLGLSRFSMHPNSLPIVKSVVAQSHTTKLKKLAKKLINSQHHEQFVTILNKFSGEL